MEFDESFRLRCSESNVDGRSQSSRMLLPESSISSDSEAIAKYDRLSPSTRSFPCDEQQQQADLRPQPEQKAGVRRLLTYAFTKTVAQVPKKAIEADASDREKVAAPAKKEAPVGSSDVETTSPATEKKKKKKNSSWSSWLPDPNRRWPVQGW